VTSTVKVTEKDATFSEADRAVSAQVNVEVEPALALERLYSEEASLIQEKQDLTSLKEKLSAKAKEEIEKKKSEVLKLKADITILRANCEELAKSLNIGAAQPPK
jgi:hypothetical protein